MRSPFAALFFLSFSVLSAEDFLVKAPPLPMLVSKQEQGLVLQLQSGGKIDTRPAGGGQDPPRLRRLDAQRCGDHGWISLERTRELATRKAQLAKTTEPDSRDKEEPERRVDLRVAIGRRHGIAFAPEGPFMC